MTIGIDVSQSIFGTGVSNYTIELVNHLPQSDLVLFGSSLRRRGEFATLFPKVKTYSLPPSLLNLLWNQLHLVNFETFTGPLDVYHSSDWVQAPSKAKKITTIHDLSPFLYPQELDPQIVAVQTARMKWVAKECDQIICVSHNTASDLQRLFSIPVAKIKIIYEALPSVYQLTPQLTKYTNYLITIGTRQPRKNITRLISSFQKYKSHYDLPDKLIIIGENPQTTNDPNIVFTGYVSDQTLVDLLAGAKAFVYPSLYEGFGLPILGAFHLGIPVAASNTSSIPEVAGDAAILFDPLDEEAIASSISQAIKSKEKLVSLGKKQLTKFSWETTAQETMKVYEDLV